MFRDILPDTRITSCSSCRNHKKNNPPGKSRYLLIMMTVIILSGLISVDIWSSAKVKANLYLKSIFPDLMPLTEPASPAIVGVCRSNDEELEYPAPIEDELTIEQVDAVTRLAVERAGGFADIIQPGDWVVIKPNIVVAPLTVSESMWVNGSATDLRVIKSVIEQLIEEGDAGRITVAEGKTWRKVGEDGTPVHKTMDGWKVSWPHYGGLSYEQMIADLDATTDIQIEYMDLDYYNTSPYTKDVPVPGGGLSQDTYTIPNAILDCDRLIAIAAMKTHFVTKVSLIQKLYIGISPGEVYTRFTKPADKFLVPFINPDKDSFRSRRSPYTISGGLSHIGVPHGFDVNDRTDRTLCDLISYHPPDFGMITSFFGVEGFGPCFPGTTIKRNMVIAGKDFLAVDSIGAYSMGFNPWDLDSSHWNHKKGFGIFDLNNIDVIGPPLNDIVHEFEKATDQGRGCRAWLVNGPHTGLSIDRNYLSEPEETIAPEEGDITAGITWTAFSDYNDYMDLAKFYGGAAFCNTYAFTRIMADSDMDVRLRFGSDDGIKIWLNGSVIFKDRSSGNFRWVEEDIPIHLQNGENTLLVKVKNSIRDYGFSMFVCEPDGDTPMGVRYSIYPTVL